MTDRSEITAKREAAAQARRLAYLLDSTEDRARALKYAADLEAEADALERASTPRTDGAD